MKNKEDIFLIGLIIVIIVLVVALFMTPARVAVVDGEGEGSASINIADPPREAIERQNTPDPIIRPVETPVVTSEPEPEPEPEEEPEEVIITLASGRFTPNDIEIESGTMVTFISEDDFKVYQIDLVSYGKHSYSPRIQEGESWSVTLVGPQVFYYNAVGYESRKARITVDAP